MKESCTSRYSEDNKSRKNRETDSERTVHKRWRKDYSSKSDSESSCSSHDSDNKERIRKELKYSKFSDKKSRWETKNQDSSRNDNRSYNSVKIKEEPVSDDERNRRNSRWNKNNRTDSWRGDKSKRSRWNESTGRGNTGSPGRTKLIKEEREPHWGKPGESSAGHDKKKPVVNIAKPDFGLSGKLAEETNTYNGVVIKYSEPPEARKPKRRWRLYPFKGDSGLPTLYIHRQSAFLIGRDRKVADIPVDHPSCSKQHAALQYRLVPFENSDGRAGKRICPYIIDLESANGTFVNNVKIETKKYVQLFEKDVIKFAFSSREYVLLHEHSKDSDEDDNM